MVAGTQHPAAGLRPKGGRPPPNSRDWGGSRKRTRAAGFIRYPTLGPGREPAEGAAHTRRPALTAQVVGPLVQHALHGARGPLAAPARRGDASRPHILGPGAGSPRQPGSTSFGSRGCACAWRGRCGRGRAAAREDEGGAAPEAAVAGAFLRPLSPQRPPRRARACPLRRAHAPKSTPGFGRGAEGLAGGRGSDAHAGGRSPLGFRLPGFCCLISSVSVEIDRG